jgi:hypothetical protein
VQDIKKIYLRFANFWTGRAAGAGAGDGEEGEGRIHEVILAGRLVSV